jgi:predicted ABC-type ATPase
MDPVWTYLTQGVRAPRRHKVLWLLCGAAGAGKTSARDRLIPIQTTFVYLNMDQLVEHFPDRTRSDLEALLTRALTEGYSVVVDATCRNASMYMRALTLAKERQYTTGMTILYASLATVVERVRARTHQPVPISVVREIYAHLSKQVHRYLTTPFLDWIHIYTTEPTVQRIYMRQDGEVTCPNPHAPFYVSLAPYC